MVMKNALITLVSGDLPTRTTTALRPGPEPSKARVTTWMDRVEAEKAVMSAQREGARVVVIGRDAARAFEFRDPGTINRNASPKANVWYEVPTSGSLPPIPIAWVESKDLERFLESVS
jgi:hypothetical protein